MIDKDVFYFLVVKRVLVVRPLKKKIFYVCLPLIIQKHMKLFGRQIWQNSGPKPEGCLPTFNFFLHMHGKERIFDQIIAEILQKCSSVLKGFSSGQ